MRVRRRRLSAGRAAQPSDWSVKVLASRELAPCCLPFLVTLMPVTIKDQGNEVAIRKVDEVRIGIGWNISPEYLVGSQRSDAIRRTSHQPPHR